MKNPIRVSVLALLVCLLAAPFATPVQDEAETPLEVAMAQLQSGQRKLRKLVAQPDEGGAAQDVVRSMQAAAVEALGHPPAPHDDGSPIAWRIGFQRQLVALLDQLLVLELALAEGRVDDAKASYATLNEIKKAGHDRYQHEEE